MVFRNLPEVRSAHEILGVPSVSARFGTAPFFWNWGMEAMTKLFPSVCSSHLVIVCLQISAIVISVHENISLNTTLPLIGYSIYYEMVTVIMSCMIF
jgi:hypothetical protein